MSSTQDCVEDDPGEPEKSQRFKRMMRRLLLCGTVISFLSGIITIGYWPLPYRIIGLLSRQIPTEPHEVTRRLVSAEYQEAQGQLGEAIASYKKALSLIVNQGNQLNNQSDQRQLEAELNGRIGTLYWRLGDLGKAELAFGTMQAIYIQIGMLQKQAVAMHTISRLFASMGRTEKALELLDEALGKYAEAKDVRGQMRAHLDYAAVVMNTALSPSPVRADAPSPWELPGPHAEAVLASICPDVSNSLDR